MSIDFRKMGLSVGDIGGRVTFGESIDIVAGLRETAGTYTHASVNGWNWPASMADLMTMIHVERVLNYLRDEKAAHITLPRPWPARANADVTDAERARLTARLAGSVQIGK